MTDRTKRLITQIAREQYAQRQAYVEERRAHLRADRAGCEAAHTKIWESLHREGIQMDNLRSILGNGERYNRALIDAAEQSREMHVTDWESMFGADAPPAPPAWGSGLQSESTR